MPGSESTSFWTLSGHTTDWTSEYNLNFLTFKISFFFFFSFKFTLNSAIFQCWILSIFYHIFWMQHYLISSCRILLKRTTQKKCNNLYKIQVSNYESNGSSYEIGEVPNSDSHYGLDDILIDVPTMEESSADFTGTGLTRNKTDQQVLSNQIIIDSNWACS